MQPEIHAFFDAAPVTRADRTAGDLLWLSRFITEAYKQIADHRNVHPGVADTFSCRQNTVQYLRELT